MHSSKAHNPFPRVWPWKTEPRVSGGRGSRLRPMRQLFCCAVLSALLPRIAVGMFQDAPATERSLPIAVAMDPSWQFPSHKVNPDTDLLSILVTINPSDNELGYLQNQLRTFAHFFAVDSVRDYLLVTPRAHLQKVQAFVLDIEAALNLPLGLLKAVPEDRCCAQFHPKHPYAGRRENGQPVFSGWVKQQLVKVSCAKLIRTPYYLVLDADVLFVMPRTASDFFNRYECSDSSPVCDQTGKIGFQSMNDAYPLYDRNEEQKIWMRNAAESLQLTVPIDWRVAQGVTPQILSTDTAIQMGHWIQSRFLVDSWTNFLLEIILRDARDYKDEEKRRVAKWYPPWTEYTLYWIYASHSGAWEAFHSVSNPAMLNLSVWGKRDFDNFHPCNATHTKFADVGSAFTLIQSSTAVDSREAWARIQPCLAHASSRRNGGPHRFAAQAPRVDGR